MPELPTVGETLPGYEASIWLGLMAPAGTPEAAVQRLHAEVTRILESQLVMEAMARGGAQPMPMPLATFDGFVRRDSERQRAWIRMAGIEVE
jgi:tripartite-type tricarboxylate transporter receptor subunit TctC